MHCKKLTLFVCGLAILLASKTNISGNPNTDLNWKNADFVIFQDSISSNNEARVFPEDRSGMQAWYLALRKAAMLLPADFVKEIATDFEDSNCLWEIRPGCVRTIKFGFFIDSASWATAYPDSINLRSSATELPDWLTWEPFPKDGYSEEERIWIALHEFAHRYQWSSNRDFTKDQDSFRAEPPTTLYGCAMGYTEGFADTFALYVMFPNHLKRFPLHYNGAKDILGREYEAKFQMPNSVRSKLTDPINGCRQYDQEMARIQTKKLNDQFLLTRVDTK